MYSYMYYLCVQPFYSEALMKGDAKKQKVLLRILKRVVSKA